MFDVSRSCQGVRQGLQVVAVFGAVRSVFTRASESTSTSSLS